MSRRRRRQLQVSTFPFIAVLLCAMGSLILLLLVLDRRAKLVARAKATQIIREAEETTKEQQHILAKQEAEWQRQQQELHDFLLKEEQAVLAELNQAKTKTSQVQQELQAKHWQNAALVQSLLQEQYRLEQLKSELQQKQAFLSQAKQETNQANQELIKLETDLAQLELALQNLKKLRAKQQRTYSVIPYKGQLGDNRKPHYIECVASGVIFHPDRKVFTGPGFSPLLVRHELDTRIQARQAREPKLEKLKKPYLFLLVRPEGLDSFYAMQTAVAGLKIDFGYELVDGDWLLDFTDDGKIGPASESPLMAAIPKGMFVPGKTVKGYQNTPGKIGPGNSPSPGGYGSGPLVHEPIWKPSNGGTIPGKGTLGGNPGLQQEKPGGTNPTVPNKSSGQNPFQVKAGNGSGNTDKKPDQSGTFTAPPLHAGGPNGKPQEATGKPGQTGGQEGNKEKGKDKGDPGSVDPKSKQAQGETNSAKGEPATGNPQGTSNSSKNPGGENPPNEESIPAFLPAYGPLKKSPPRGFIPYSRLLGNRDWYIDLDCNDQGLKLRLIGEHFSLDALKTAPPGEHPLRKAVRELIAEKQATVRPGEFPYRPHLRFEVLPEGLRAYLLAYSILEDLRLPVIRHNIEPHVPTLEDYYRKK